MGTIIHETFLDDTKTQDAIIRNLEIIGEVAKGVSEQLQEGQPQIPWRNMMGMRDRLIRHYFGVNLDIIWQVVSRELPEVALSLANFTDQK